MDKADDGARSARELGRAKMEEVYGFSVDPDQIEGPYVATTVDHLFGAVWTRPALGVRDRRLMTLGMLAALGQHQLIEIQFQSALEKGELDEAQVREIVLHVAHYVGWPLSTGVNEVAERVIARRRKGAGLAAPRGTTPRQGEAGPDDNPMAGADDTASSASDVTSEPGTEGRA